MFPNPIRGLKYALGGDPNLRSSTVTGGGGRGGQRSAQEQIAYLKTLSPEQAKIYDQYHRDYLGSNWDKLNVWEKLGTSTPPQASEAVASIPKVPLLKCPASKGRII